MELDFSMESQKITREDAKLIAQKFSSSELKIHETYFYFSLDRTEVTVTTFEAEEGEPGEYYGKNIGLDKNFVINSHLFISFEMFEEGEVHFTELLLFLKEFMALDTANCALNSIWFNEIFIRKDGEIIVNSDLDEEYILSSLRTVGFLNTDFHNDSHLKKRKRVWNYTFQWKVKK